MMIFHRSVWTFIRMVVVLFLCAGMFLPAAADNQIDGQGQGGSAPAASYVLGVDDVLSMVLYGEDELSGDYKIASDGTIAVPLIGEVDLAGLSIREAEARLVALLSDGYFIEPSVSLSVAEYRPFYILGEVRTPGHYSYVNGMSVLTAVALAGGFTYRADRDEVKVLRTQSGRQMRHDDVSIEDTVMPGDIILVEERFF